MATDPNRHSDDEEEEEDNRIFYKMDADPRGICLIINIRDFDKDPTDPEAKSLQPRLGTDIDKEALDKIFRHLKFSVRHMENLKDTEITNAIRELATEDHTDYDCLVVCILSHGSLGHVYGSNGLAVSLQDLTFHVKPKNCPSLAGKPKLFFVQACQGTERQIGFPTMERDTSPMPEVLVPNEGDFLLSYATVPGFESYRDPERGSAFISKLTWYLRKYSTTEDILQILTRVNNAVAREHHTLEDSHAYKQCPAPLYTLRKKVFFGTGITSLQASPQPVPEVSELDVGPGGSSGNDEGLAENLPTIAMGRRYSCMDVALSCRPSVLFQVEVTTGDVPEAGTDATIHLTFFGIKGTTPPMMLPTGVGSTRGKTDTFQLHMKDVSPLKKLRVSIDPGHRKKALWSLDKIKVLNTSTFTETVFHYAGWLGTGKDANTWVDIPAMERGKKLLEETTYKVSVKTSDVRLAGTDADVYVVLFGVNGDSGELHLEESETHKNPFERDHIDVFTFSNILSLGELFKLRVWHDNKGVGAAWHLSSIDVTDLSTHKVYKFCCDRWLSSDNDDHQTLRELICTQPSGPAENVVYEIEVKTSAEEHSGTFHNGWLVLEGNLATSKVFFLENSTLNRILQRGQTNFFTLVSPPLGSLETCRIGAYERRDRPIQAEKGCQACWRCEEVAVTDTSSGMRTTFPCGSWVKVLPTVPEREDGIKCSAMQHQETHWAKVRDQSAVKYEVAVYTGEVTHGGTDANVFICIFGENGDTGKRPLKKSLRNLFEPGKGDKFVLEAVELGQLQQVHIEHDNTNVAPDWFLDHVIITNMDTQCTTCFPCRRWLNKESNYARELRPCTAGSPATGSP